MRGDQGPIRLRMKQSESLRREYRRVTLVAMIVAAGIHGVVFLANPSVSIETPSRSVVQLRVELFLPAPSVVAIDGSPVTGEVLPDLAVGSWRQAQLGLWRHWPRAYQAYGVGGQASLELVLDGSGEVMRASVLESSGDTTKDDAFERMALALRYRWPESDRELASLLVIQSFIVERPAVPLRLRLDSVQAENVP